MTQQVAARAKASPGLVARALGRRPAATVRDRAVTRVEAIRLGHVAATGPRTRAPIFVISQPRTGSGLLNDLLDGLDGMAMGSEVLHPHWPSGVPGRVFRLMPLRHIEWRLAALDAPRRGAVLHTGQMARAGITLGDLERRWPDARYLATYRRSLGDMYVSRRVATQTGSWTLRPGDDRPVPPPLRVPRERLVAELDGYRRAFTATLTDPVIRRSGRAIAFEDLADDPRGTFATQVLPHLGLEGTEPPQPRLRRQRNYERDEIIVNLDEVADLIASTYVPPAAAPTG